MRVRRKKLQNAKGDIQHGYERRLPPLIICAWIDATDLGHRSSEAKLLRGADAVLVQRWPKLLHNGLVVALLLHLQAQPMTRVSTLQHIFCDQILYYSEE
jgi:hypothetical protein